MIMFNNFYVWQRYFVAALITLPISYGIVTNIPDFSEMSTTSTEQVVYTR